MRMYKYKCLVMVFLGLTGLLSACGGNELEEPAVYTPNQLRYILTGDSVKLWQQISRYYLEDSCRTGYYLQFSENADLNSEQHFYASFYRNGAACLGATSPFVAYNAEAVQTQPYLTSDTLLLLQVTETDTTIFSKRVIRLLTSQQLLMDVLGPNNTVLHREEYRVVEEEEPLVEGEE